MRRIRRTTPAARAALEIGTALTFGVVAWAQGAPTWALTLLAFVATRASAIDLYLGLSEMRQRMIAATLDTAFDRSGAAKRREFVEELKRREPPKETP